MAEVIRVIYLPGAEKWIGLAAYVAGVKKAKANPSATFESGISCWWPCTGREIVGQFWDGVQDRINQGTPYHLRGTRHNHSTDAAVQPPATGA